MLSILKIIPTGKRVLVLIEFLHIDQLKAMWCVLSHRSPVLKLENAKGLSNDKVLELEKEIQCMAAELVGEVLYVIYDLIYIDQSEHCG